MSINGNESLDELLDFLQDLLMDPEVGEICINDEYNVWAEVNGIFQRFQCDKDRDHISSLCTAIASFNGTEISEINPSLAGILPSGQRVQIVFPPASKNISITIRNPSDGVIDIYDYPLAFFGKESIRDTLIESVSLGKNIVVAGETGSGKTTVLKTLCKLMDPSDRIVTIEDTEELFIQQSHSNAVSMFYGELGRTASDALVDALRMKPTRIILGEIRKGTAMDLINVITSGHGGSLSSLHAGSCNMAIIRLIQMAMMSPEGKAVGPDFVKQQIEEAIDVIVHITNDKYGRRITDIKLK